MYNLANLPQGFVHVRAFLALGKRVEREITRSRVRVLSDYQLDVTGLLVPWWPVTVCLLILLCCFFLLSSLSFVFNYFRKKEKSRKLAGKLSVFHLRFGKTGDKKRATCIALCPTTIASYKPMLRVLPPTDKNLSFLLPVFHSFYSNVAKQVARFCCPSP